MPYNHTLASKYEPSSLIITLAQAMMTACDRNKPFDAFGMQWLKLSHYYQCLWITVLVLKVKLMMYCSTISSILVLTWGDYRLILWIMEFMVFHKLLNHCPI